MWSDERDYNKATQEERERPTTKSRAFGPPPYSAKPNRDDKLRNKVQAPITPYNKKIRAHTFV